MKPQKIIPLFFSLSISISCAGCGNAGNTMSNNVPDNSSVISNSYPEVTINEQINTTKLSEETTVEDTTAPETDKVTPKKPTYKYPSISENSLGLISDFESDLENKLSELLGRDEFYFYLESKDGPDARPEFLGRISYNYRFTCSKLELEGHYILEENANNPGDLQSVTVNLEGGIWNAVMNPNTGENSLYSLKEKRIFKTSVCVLLAPLAVWENYSTEEEILSRWREYDLYLEPKDGYDGQWWNDEEEMGKSLWTKLTKKSGKNDYFDSEVMIFVHQAGDAYSTSGGSSAKWTIPQTNIWEEE